LVADAQADVVTKFGPKLNLTFNEAQARIVNIALSNTFGFGGHNTSIIFKKFDA